MTIPLGSGGGSPYNQPNFPDAVSDGVYFDLGKNAILHNGTNIDTILLPALSTGFFEGTLRDLGVYSVLTSSVNASVNAWLSTGGAIWYDSINDRVYIFGVDTATTPDTLYTAYFNPENGGVTNVGSVQLTNQPNDVTSIGCACVTRANIDSGDFTLDFADYTIVIDSTDGSEVSNTARTTAFPTAPSFQATYKTIDGTLFTGVITSGYMNMANNTDSVQYRLPVVEDMYGRGPNIAIYMVRWGNFVKIFSSENNRYNVRTFNLVDFDTWVMDFADFAGIK